MKDPRLTVSALVFLVASGATLPISSMASAQTFTFTHLAGSSGGPGWFDGTGSGARFWTPCGVAVDVTGNVYVADSFNSTIRKVTPAGSVTTLAGLAGRTGSTDGTGNGARFYYPTGVAVDSTGNVYVADRENHTIRRVTPAGVVTTLAGLAGSAGSADGTGNGARFHGPAGVAVDLSGNLYVADYGNRTIRKVTPSGVVTTLAGLAGSTGSTDGTGNGARLYGPNGVAVDGSGNVYVADRENHTIRRVTPAGVVTTLAGLAGTWGSTDGTGSGARFYGPADVAVDLSGNLYVADSGNRTIRKVTPSGVVTTVAGLAESIGSTDGTGNGARFYYPTGVAVDSTGNVYVADRENHTIRRVTPAGVVTTLTGLAGTWGSTDGTGSGAQFYSPRGVAADVSGNVYVADFYNSTIRKVTPSGVVTTLAGLAENAGSTDGTGNGARFNSPTGVAVDSAGNVYVADSWNHAIRKVTASGIVTTLVGLAGTRGSTDGTGGGAQFYFPTGVAVDLSGNLYVADYGNSTIRKVTPSGVVTTLAGLAENTGSTDGTGSGARFLAPYGVAVDFSGNLYVADSGNSTIRKVTPSGVVTTLAGLARSIGGNDGTGSGARFFVPTGVAVDLSGNLYVADSRNHTVRKVTPAGVVTTLAGLAEIWGSIDGSGSGARFYSPTGVAVDVSGNVYVADLENHTIWGGAAALPDKATIDPSTGPSGNYYSLGSSPKTASSWQWEVVRRPVDAVAQLTSTTTQYTWFAPDRDGLYTFRLASSDGARSSITTVDLSVVASPPTADFLYAPPLPIAGEVVTFTDTSTGSPTSWSWSFGDGGTSTARNPTHMFAMAGSYGVTLTVVNSAGSNVQTRTVTVTGSATKPVISYFVANPQTVIPGQQTTLSWSSTGGTSASVDQGVGDVPTSGSKSITPSVGVPYKLTVVGPGGSTSATVTIAADPSTYVATWLLPSSARVAGQNAFWTTDLVMMNSGSATAIINVKFLGHDGNGAGGPEQTFTIPARATSTFPDVLSSAFGRESDWGPILIRSSVSTIAALGQTWTASATGGTYGQSVPAHGASEFVGSSAKALAGLRQDSLFRTNIVLANVKESDASVTVQVLLKDGTTATTQTYVLGPLGFRQLNLANDLGVGNFAGGGVLVSCSTPGCQVAAYASVIDATTADPRTILAR